MSANETNTLELIAQFRSGCGDALSRLVERELPALRRYASGRLPPYARGAVDTQDLVHDVLLRAMPRVLAWRCDAPGALQALLRRAVANRVIDEIRKVRRRLTTGAPIDSYPDPAPSPLAQSIARQNRARLRAALETISGSDRALLEARFGCGLRYAEMATRVGRPNANAARTAVGRAVARVGKAMAQGGSADKKVH